MTNPFQWLKKAMSMPFEWYARNGYHKLYQMLGGGGPSWSGESVTVDVALNHSVVWACERVISESEAFLPLSLMLQSGDSKIVAGGHPTHNIVHFGPNDEMTTMTFRETLTGHLVTQGNCFAQIFRRSGTGTAYELYPILPEQVDIDRDKRKRLVYVIKEGNSADRTYTVERGKLHDILHIPGLGYDGTKGYSVIRMARQSIGNSIAVEKYAARHFAAGGRQPGYIELAQKFRSPEERDAARADLDKFFKDPENSHKVPMFEPGMAFKPYSWSPEDSQFLETRNWGIPEICRWFLISPHMVGDLSRATFSNIEHLALQFLKMTLTAWIVRWEQNLWRCVLTPDEKAGGYFFRHNLNGLLRGDFASRMAGYASALQNGHLNIDEVRDLEERNPLPGGIGKDHRVQLNMQVVGQPQPDLTPAEKQALGMDSSIQELIQSVNQFQQKFQQKEFLQ